MATLLLFAQARELAGTKSVEINAATVGEMLDTAVARFGSGFGALLPHCRLWRNGEPTERNETVSAGDEIAVLPPVSGG